MPSPSSAPATIDLIVPARNEQENIGALMTAIPQDAFRQVVLADNGSTDQTAELARGSGAIVVHEPQRGYGAACQAALRHLETSGPPDLVAFLDADLADDPALLPGLCRLIVNDQADLVIGSRRRLAEPGALTMTQRFGNLLACVLIRWLTGVTYRDLGPMRAVRWSSLQHLDMKDRTWGWTVEMQYKAAVQNLRVMTIDVPYRRRRAGVSKISGSWMGSVRAGYKILATIGGLWWQSRVAIGRSKG